MLAAFSISLPRLGLWSSARVSPDIVSSHDLAAPFPPSGLRRALAIALTTTAIVVQWKSKKHCLALLAGEFGQKCSKLMAGPELLRFHLGFTVV